MTSPLKRGWLVSPFGYDVTLQVWAYFAAVIPALLLYTLLFMETHICEYVAELFESAEYVINLSTTG